MTVAGGAFMQPSPVDDTPQWMQGGTPSIYTPQGALNPGSASYMPVQPGLPATPGYDVSGPGMPIGAFLEALR